MRGGREGQDEDMQALREGLADGCLREEEGPQGAVRGLFYVPAPAMLEVRHEEEEHLESEPEGERSSEALR